MAMGLNLNTLKKLQTKLNFQQDVSFIATKMKLDKKYIKLKKKIILFGSYNAVSSFQASQHPERKISFTGV